MKNKVIQSKFIRVASVIFLIALAAPYLVFADHNQINSSVFLPGILAGPLTLCVGAQPNNSGSGNLPTCNNLCDLIAQIAQIIYFIIALVIWIIAPILIAVGGIMIMIGGANPGMIETGKKTITGAVWGIVIVLCAWLIVATFVQFIGISKIGGFSQGAPACKLP